MKPAAFLRELQLQRFQDGLRPVKASGSPGITGLLPDVSGSNVPIRLAKGVGGQDLFLVPEQAMPAGNPPDSDSDGV